MTAIPVRKDLRSPFRFADYGLAASAILVALVGVATNYAATWRLLEFEGEDPAFFAKRQAVFVLIGIAGMAVTALVDYRVFSDFSTQIYLAVTGLLVLVLFIGVERNGAKSWFELPGFQLQPSEFAKLACIIALAAFVANHEGYLRLDTLTNALIIVAVPMALIFRQPDIGTMLVFVAVAMGMLLVAGAQLRHIVLTTLAGVFAILLVFNVDNWFGVEPLLNTNQESRLTSFVNPEANILTTGYNQNQSQIALGNGGLTGQGWLQGSQTSLNLVPEQETDFIFTALGEEFGFVGGAGLLAVYAFMLSRVWRAAQTSQDLFGTFLCVGVLSMLLFQIFQNVGMTMGIMPITGIPLPFMSHGGSSTLVAFAAIGLVINVHSRRHLA